MPSKLVIALALSPAAALQLPGVGEVALKLPSAPALPSTKDLKVAAIDFVAEARQNPVSALPAAAAGGEVLVPGAPFQPENGYLGMWNWEKQGKAVPKDQTPEVQKALRTATSACGTGRSRARPCPRTRR